MISIIPTDSTIVIDGISANSGDSRVSSMFQTNVHAIQFFPDKNIGHIEYVKDIYDSNPIGNKMITSEDIDVASIISLHNTVLEEQKGDKNGR